MLKKRFLVDKLFSELALAGYAFDIDPEEQQDAASTLELMVAGWLADGIGLPFSFAADQSSIDLDADSGVPLSQARTVYTSAAIAFAAPKGKTLMASTTKAAAEGYSRLLRAAAFPPPVQMPSTLPAGAGNKPWRLSRNPFMPTPDTGPLQIAEDGGLNFGS